MYRKFEIQVCIQYTTTNMKLSNTKYNLFTKVHSPVYILYLLTDELDPLAVSVDYL